MEKEVESSLALDIRYRDLVAMVAVRIWVRKERDSVSVRRVDRDMGSVAFD